MNINIINREVSKVVRYQGRESRELLQIVLCKIIYFLLYGLGDANEGSSSIREKNISNFSEQVNIETTEHIKDTSDKLGVPT